MAWIITRDYLNSGMVGAGVYHNDVELKDCPKKFTISDSEGVLCYAGVATADEVCEQTIVMHTIGRSKLEVRMERIAA